MRCAAYSVRVGSSPLARGPHNMSSSPLDVLRLIPARAGTTLPCRCFSGRLRAHPRSRGDHRTRYGTPQNARGSSPLARGPPRAKSAPVAEMGLIPARAGTTPKVRCRGCCVGAHPRSRGDHRSRCECVPFLAGSSPLARGPRFIRRQGNQGCGLIPARAGTTLTAELERNRGAGLIPARAGTTTVGASRNAVIGAHPRSRGDHDEVRARLLELGGSSPLARGPLRLHLRGTGRCGLIPARAGTTGTPKGGCVKRGAHPRSRGDHNFFR